MISRLLCSCLGWLALGASSLAADAIDPPQGGVIVLLGGGQGERLLRWPFFEAELQERFAGRDLTIRNQIGRSHV